MISGPKLLRDDIASPLSQPDLISSHLSRISWPFVGPSAEHRHSANQRAFWAVGICAGAREEVSLATATHLKYSRCEYYHEYFDELLQQRYMENVKW